MSYQELTWRTFWCQVAPSITHLSSRLDLSHNHTLLLQLCHHPTRLSVAALIAIVTLFNTSNDQESKNLWHISDNKYLCTTLPDRDTAWLLYTQMLLNPSSNKSDAFLAVPPQSILKLPTNADQFWLQQCFGTYNDTQYQDTGLDQDWRLWQFQVCTQWGYFTVCISSSLLTILF